MCTSQLCLAVDNKEMDRGHLVGMVTWRTNTSRQTDVSYEHARDTQANLHQPGARLLAKLSFRVLGAPTIALLPEIHMPPPSAYLSTSLLASAPNGCWS